MEAAFKQELEKQAYYSFSLKYLPGQACYKKENDTPIQVNTEVIELLNFSWTSHLFTTQNFHCFKCFELKNISRLFKQNIAGKKCRASRTKFRATFSEFKV